MHSPFCFLFFSFQCKLQVQFLSVLAVLSCLWYVCCIFMCARVWKLVFFFRLPFVIWDIQIHKRAHTQSERARDRYISPSTDGKTKIGSTPIWIPLTIFSCIFSPLIAMPFLFVSRNFDSVPFHVRRNCHCHFIVITKASVYYSL